MQEEAFTIEKIRYTKEIYMKKNQKFLFDFWYIAWCGVILGIAFFSYKAVVRLIHVWPKESIEQKLDGSILRVGSWFIRNQKPEGNFVYEQYTLTGEETQGDNNIVRQAGALYGLGHLYRYNKDPAIAEVFEKGLMYFNGLIATPSADMATISYEGSIFTNTTALVVLGLVEYMEADEQKKTIENLEYLVRLSNYLVSTQTSTGAYVNDFLPTPVESDYNNGETMYALIRSYHLTQKESYLLSVKRMANYAIDHYGKQKFNSSFFSWGMAGFSYLYMIDADERYWKFMTTSIDTYFTARGDRYEKYLKNKSGSMPIAPSASVFLEGLNHVGWIAKEKDPVLYTRLKNHVKKVLEYLLVYEINSPYGKYKSEDVRVSGAICAKDTCETTRVDFMQHNLSAMYLYLRFFK